MLKSAGKTKKGRGQRKTAPPIRLIVGSFVLVILLGTLVLILPPSSSKGAFTHTLDAHFTATSAERKSTRLNSSHSAKSPMPSYA